MSDTELAAQHLAQAIARMWVAQRNAEQATARLTRTYAVVRTRYRLQP